MHIEDVIGSSVMMMLLSYMIAYPVLLFLVGKQYKAGKFKRGNWLLNQVIRFYAKPNRALMVRSLMHLNYFHDFTGAIKDSNRIIDWDKKSALAYHNRGFAEAQLGQFSQAESDYTMALSLKPNLAPILINRGQLRFEHLDDFDGAIEDFEAAIRLQPLNFMPYYRVIDAYCERKDYDLALQVCESAKDTLHHPAYIRLLRGYILQQQLGIEQALDDMNTAATLAPDDILVDVLRGDIFSMAHDYHKAVEIYSRVLRLKPKYHLVYNARGYAFAQLGQHEKAMTDYHQSIELYPYHGETFNNRAFDLARQGQYEEALKDANRCIQLAPAFKNGYGTRGLIYYLMKDYPAALADFTKASN